ncbi:MAG: hypothetical protein KDD25_09865, partial [Bdellovibrionales bacterium]|nr:hypothetical protein [Bdellovibrionales bacterium]
SFDVDSELVSVLRFDNGAFLAINATKIDPKDNGGWEYFWDNSSKGYVARVIYSTNGHLLIQHFTHYTNQQLGFSEYQLDCK